MALFTLSSISYSPTSIYSSTIPTISVNDLSTSELGAADQAKVVSLTVSLSTPSATTTAVPFKISNGTATQIIYPSPVGDYTVAANTGTLNIPANSLTGSISLKIVGDNNTLETNETIFVDIGSSTSEYVGSYKIARRRGTCTIIEPKLSLSTGGFDLGPDNAPVDVGDTIYYAINWIVPDNEVWRDLTTIDFRIRNRNKTALWVRWDETSNLVSHCQADKPGQSTSVKRGSGVTCTEGKPLGSDVVLATTMAELDLAESGLISSGPTGKTVTLVFAVRFLDGVKGDSFDVELAATDDFLREDDFIRVGTVHVYKGHGKVGQ